MNRSELTVSQITGLVYALLEPATDDYAVRIQTSILANVIDDMYECIPNIESTGFTKGDIALAIGRVLCRRLNIEI